jgi:hypothetical protein
MWEIKRTRIENVSVCMSKMKVGWLKKILTFGFEGRVVGVLGSPGSPEVGGGGSPFERSS